MTTQPGVVTTGPPGPGGARPPSLPPPRLLPAPPVPPPPPGRLALGFAATVMDVRPAALAWFVFVLVSVFVCVWVFVWVCASVFVCVLVLVFVCVLVLVLGGLPPVEGGNTSRAPAVPAAAPAPCVLPSGPIDCERVPSWSLAAPLSCRPSVVTLAAGSCPPAAPSGLWGPGTGGACGLCAPRSGRPESAEPTEWLCVQLACAIVWCTLLWGWAPSAGSVWVWGWVWAWCWCCRRGASDRAATPFSMRDTRRRVPEDLRRREEGSLVVSNREASGRWVTCEWHFFIHLLAGSRVGAAPGRPLETPG